MKERIIQFGEGNFLRAFVDYFIDVMNKQDLFDGKVVVVQPLANGMVSKLNDQEGKYHLFLRGVEKGEKVDSMELIESISRGIDPYKDFDAYLALAENSDIRFIVSNTTEAGIEYIGTEKQDDRPAKSFPAKVTQLLAKRFKLGLPGFIFLPCELIDDNAVYLKKYILQYADLWELGDDFKTWIEEENVFCNTLVDRITTGYPRDQLAEFEARVSFPDHLIDTAEAFYLWVIEGDHEDELPLQKAGLNVVWTPDVKPYKKRKVRILNGGHTSMVTGALLYGMETVGQCMENSLVRPYLDHVLFEEVVPTLGSNPEDIQFAKDVEERFENPFVHHRLDSIVLNTVSKFETRVLPTILEHKEKFGSYPKGLVMSLASLIAFYRTDQVKDMPEVVDFMKDASIDAILAKTDYWKVNLSDMKDMVEYYYNIIQEEGMEKAYQDVLGQA